MRRGETAGPEPPWRLGTPVRAEAGLAADDEPRHLALASGAIIVFYSVGSVTLEITFAGD